jgi:heme/copper-type cytochrome/quinol oxidase subunit 2
MTTADSLAMLGMLWLAVPIALAVLGVAVYASWRFR